MRYTHIYEVVMIDREWFKQKMRDNNLTQDDMGRIIGKDRSTFSRLISGEFEFKFSYLEAIAKAFKTNKMEIMQRVGLLDDGDFIDNNQQFRHIESAINAFKNGEILIVTDDYDRENEGDLIVSGRHCTPEKMAFIVRHTSGIVCAPISSQIAKRLNLTPMVADNDAPHSTAFTISIDAKYGTTTGISAQERNVTIHALVNNNNGPDEFVRPGHIFPLVAREGGVLVRSGHTEAAVDLCKLAGHEEVGVICEMVNDDGSVMRGSQISDFAKTHNLKHITIAELIAYRQSKEKLVERVSSFIIPSIIGDLKAISYTTRFDTLQHLALVYGDIEGKKNITTRLHRADIIDDVFGGSTHVNQCLEKIKNAGCGVLIYLRDGALGVPNAPLKSKNVEQDDSQTRQAIWREVGIGAQILRDMGVDSINLITRSNPKFAALQGFGIAIDGITRL